MLSIRFWQTIAGLSGFIGVAMGAAGAHIVADATAAALVEKAALYQLIHTLALLWASRISGRAANLAWLGFLVGMMLVCGSLYGKGFGLIASTPLAPAGGMLLMAGWLATAFIHTRQ